MSDIQFKKHKVEWTEVKIKNFWDYFGTNKSLLDLSFAFEVGHEIVRRTEKYIKKDGVNLDYGCGGGALLGYLFDKGITATGLDMSPESLDTTKKRFGENKFLTGLILSTKIPNDNIADNTYDFVYSIETIEHLLPESLEAYLRELYRITKKGGFVCITTPFNEDLGKKEVLCPDCGSIFHRVQHLNTFTVQSMADLMDKVGFNKVFCEATLFQDQTFINHIKALARKLQGISFTPHLIYVGKKS